MDIKFDIKRNSRGFILVRVGGEYKQHSHHKTLKSCHDLIKLIECSKLPKSKYLRGSARRLLSEEEFKNLRKPKDYYYNVNHGIR